LAARSEKKKEDRGRTNSELRTKQNKLQKSEQQDTNRPHRRQIRDEKYSKEQRQRHDRQEVRDG
jgi:hypothetical protein